MKLVKESIFQLTFELLGVSGKDQRTTKITNDGKMPKTKPSVGIVDGKANFKN